MKIDIHTIPEEGLEISVCQDQQWAVRAAESAMEGTLQDLTAELHLQKIERYVIVTGELQASVHRHCDRCQQPLSHELSGDLSLTYAPEHKGPLKAGELPEQDAMEIGWYQDDHLDISRVIEEQLALWTPFQVRCDDQGVTPDQDNTPCQLPAQVAPPSLEEERKKASPFAKIVLS